MHPIFLRIVYAVVVVLVFWIILPPLLRILGLPMSADVETILRAVVGFMAVLYIFFGFTFPNK